MLEADLVGECSATVATLAAGLATGEPIPPSSPWRWWTGHGQPSGTRRRELSARSRQVRLAGYVPPLATESRASGGRAARQIGATVRAGRLSAAAARPVFLTRVAGYSATEAASSLGRSAAVVRSMVSRAERVLVATGGY